MDAKSMVRIGNILGSGSIDHIGCGTDNRVNRLDNGMINRPASVSREHV
jgi:hypothetical protein